MTGDSQTAAYANGTVEDGFGSVWSKCERGPTCGLAVVRPGKVQCWCDDGSTEPPGGETPSRERSAEALTTSAPTTTSQQNPGPVMEEVAAEVLAENEQPSKDMVIWWNLLRPDRLAIADALDKWARDYDRSDLREGAHALRDAARWVRATAGGIDG